MRTKTLGELIRDYGRAMNIAGNYEGLGSRYAARSEQVKANALYAEIEKRLTDDDIPQLTSQNTSRGARLTDQSSAAPRIS